MVDHHRHNLGSPSYAKQLHKPKCNIKESAYDNCKCWIRTLQPNNWLVCKIIWQEILQEIVGEESKELMVKKGYAGGVVVSHTLIACYIVLVSLFVKFLCDTKQQEKDVLRTNKKVLNNAWPDGD